MKTNKMDSSLFRPDSQNEFWGKMQPDARDYLDFLENKEKWPYQYSEFPELFVTMAEALPKVADLPVNKESEDILVNLVPLLASMPFRQCVFAIHWLNNQAGSSPVGWGALCYLEAVNIINNKPDHKYYTIAKALVDRIVTAMRTRKIIGLFSQWPLKSS